MQSGHNWELVTGTDLTNESVQRKVLDYISLAAPLVVVMAPRCDPYGPLGARNRILHHDRWLDACRTAGPLASFCGKIAQVQQRANRFYVCEQPFPSQLWDVPPWPSVRSHTSTESGVPPMHGWSDSGRPAGEEADRTGEQQLACACPLRQLEVLR